MATGGEWDIDAGDVDDSFGEGCELSIDSALEYAGVYSLGYV